MCYSAMIEKDLKKISSEFGVKVDLESFERYQKVHEKDAKKYPSLSSRIFPNSYAGVLVSSVSDLKQSGAIAVARYSTFPVMDRTDKTYTSYNTRLDNIESPFWSNAFMNIHGAIIIKKFFEWVEVATLVEAGTVRLKDVKEYFEKQAEARKKKVEDLGKVFKLTPTEKKNPKDRKIMIQFFPSEEQLLIVPIILSLSDTKENKQGSFYGFSIVTTEPPKEVLHAGHERCPIFISKDSLEGWVLPNKNAKHYKDILKSSKPPCKLQHSLPEIAI